MIGPELPVLYRDNELVGVHKPAGLLTHRNAHAGREPFLVQLLRDQLGQRVYPVHRLDRPTSGLIVMALSPENAGILARQFAAHRVTKTYVAVVRGVVPEQGSIDSPLLSESGQELPACTEFVCLDTVELPFPVGRYASARFSLVRVQPKTGRTHQIRRHFAHIRHPLIGDVLRGDGRQNRFFREQLRSQRLLLASTRLTFWHPRSEEQMTLSCPLADDMYRVCSELGWQDRL